MVKFKQHQEHYNLFIIVTLSPYTIGIMFKSLRQIRVMRTAPMRQAVDFTKLSVHLEDLVNNIKSTGRIDDYFIFGPQARKKMIKEIAVHCDKEYGGKSESNWLYIDEDTPNDTALRFHGFHRKLTTDPTKKNQPIKAYNALKLDYDGKFSLDHFEGLEVVLRSTKAFSFTFSLYCSSLQEFDCMQADLDVKSPNIYYRFYVPFSAMQYSTLIDNSNELVGEIPNIDMTGWGFLLKNSPPDGGKYI